MRMSILAHRLIALLLGLCLQFQALAAVVMPCAHADAETQAYMVSGGCPHGSEAQRRAAR